MTRGAAVAAAGVPARSALARNLFAPRRIALVGATDRVGRAAARPLRFLHEHGYRGTVYPVNARRDQVGGHRAWPSLRALPEVPDHAFLMVPPEATVAAVRECAELGVPLATVLSGGFGEAGETGRELERELLDCARAGGVRLLGPNSLGLADLRSGLRLTGNAAFAEADLPTGGTVVASQSGSMIGALLSRGKARGIGFASLVSVGSELDLGIGEILDSVVDDPEVTGFALFLETIRHPGALSAFACRAAGLGKPVIAYKLGRSAEAAELAVSHTGALAGEDDVADAFLREHGIARVSTLDGLIESGPLAAATAFPDTRRAPRVAVVTTTGGGAAMVVDQLALAGVEAGTPSVETFGRLAAAGVEVAEGRIVDLTLAGTRPEVMSPALEVLSTAPEFDMVVAVIGSSARFDPELAVHPVVEAAGHGRIAVFVVPEAPEALRLLTDSGVPAFRSPESCADVVAAVLRRRAPGPVRPGPRADAATAGAVSLSEARSYDLLDTVGFPRAPFLEHDVVRPAVPPPFGFPVVVKVDDASLEHKSDVGGVVLGVAGPDELAAAIERVRTAVPQRAPGHTVSSVLVQPMARGLGEVLVGYRVDPHVGPIVMVAAGGRLAELLGDRAVRLAPVTPEVAREMLGEVRSLEALRGFRGDERGDLAALADAVVSLSQLAARPEVAEAEVNPVLVQAEGEGVVAVDALVRVYDDRIR
ncbi:MULTISPECIES: acetate--CoA ligase family protein [Pseudonocardia]|uniref:ATP-grasp domain-containing protein n=2 Tax=Pseudonocardia TaxID=1847 RepID=A0A1Y2MKP6_PSEAH|nr:MULTISPECIES: acetate--CoA ligase [Pseudonocardia]OSY35835.1 hypothetical protein BG845_05798 [Pseudonocardia autotrophica]TDN73129.1 acyl-CoA synthetase (NDP forming) [Pseudonocardia autotrophica]BBG03848.1 6-carboxyhexanoate--CoA ligase [Pseudonocardia autotrophica]GEC27353.1 6-carboxyhexanoate--CoA ligase [Pseudonocardia saturnea]